ncbi:hypothetical protein DdX_03397 [Ditylenchus destructor]|uniref:Shugoshin C-terminal domain-containing protein n=1 Tax=Ditylenchus destructor TaxID=166010 RepID=A0AAD4NJ53_9BILA|nr:hypothetical protein DdX_03397 [Ditylenchus destructor]
MSLKNKLAKAFRVDNDGVMASNQTLLQNKAQISLLYQLEQRKCQKLEDTVAQLNERIRALTNEKDDARIELLVTDRLKRKLGQLKAITNKTIASLESGLKEFHNFVSDIDHAISEQSKSGAVQSHSSVAIKPELLLPRFQPRLARVAESPMVAPVTDITNFRPSVGGLKQPAQGSNMADDPSNVNVEIATANPVAAENISTEENQRSCALRDKNKRNTRSSRVKVGQFQSPADPNSLSDTMNMEDEFLTPTSQFGCRNSDQTKGRKSSISKHVVLADLNKEPMHTSTPKQKKSETQKLQVDLRELDINKTAEKDAKKTMELANNSGKSGSFSTSTRKSNRRSLSAKTLGRANSAREAITNEIVEDTAIKDDGHNSKVSEKQTPSSTSTRRSTRSANRKSQAFTSSLRDVNINKTTERDVSNTKVQNNVQTENMDVVDESVVNETVSSESVRKEQKRSIGNKIANYGGTPARIKTKAVQLRQVAFSNITERCRSKLSSYNNYRLSGPSFANGSNADSLEGSKKPKRIRREKRAYSPSELYSSNPQSFTKRQKQAEAVVALEEQSMSSQFADQSDMQSQSLHVSTRRNSVTLLSEKRKGNVSSTMATNETKNLESDSSVKDNNNKGQLTTSKGSSKNPSRFTPTPSTSRQNIGTLEQSSSNFSVMHSGRVKRTAATMVPSYKLPPLNVKMRRE